MSILRQLYLVLLKLLSRLKGFRAAAGTSNKLERRKNRRRLAVAGFEQFEPRALLTTVDLGIINATQSVSGSIFSGETSPETADVYVFQVPSPGSLRYGITLSGMSGNLDLAVSGFGSLTSSNAGVSFESVTTPSIGAIQVQVTVLSVGNALSDYTLTISPSPESDDLITNANALPTPTATAQPTFTTFGVTGGAADPQSYYRFDLGATANLRVNLSRLRNDLNLELLDASGRVIRSSTSAGIAIEDIQVSALAAGRYFLRVFGAVGSGFDLVGTINTSSDDLLKTAQNLGTLDAALLPTVKSSGVVGGLGDPQDNFRVIVPANSNLRVELNNRSDRIFSLLDAAGRTVAASSARGTSFQTLTSEIVEAGAYYVQVTPFDPTTIGSYDLAVSVGVGTDDLLSTATNLGTVDTIVQPTIIAAGNVGGAADIQDYFKFAMSAASTIDIAFGAQTTSMRFEIANSAGRVIYAPAASSSLVNLTTDLASGTFYIRVFSASGLPSDYNLKLTPRIAPTNAQEIFPETPVSSISVTKSTGTSNSDFYRFTLTEATSIEANLLSLAGTSDRNLQLIDSVGRVIAASLNDSLTIERVFASLVQGTYYLRVFATSGLADNYELSLVRGSVGSNDDLITNAANLGALDLAFQPTVRVSSTAGALADIQDSYRFTQSQTGPVRINLSGMSANLDLQLYDASGRVRSQVRATSNLNENLSTTIPAGDYYLRVFAPVPGVTTAYDLVVTAASTSDDTFFPGITLDAVRPSTSPTVKVAGTAGGTADIQDYYKFFLSATSDLALNLGGLIADFDIELLDAVGRVIQPTSGTAAPGAAIESLNYTALQSGTYTVRVFGKPSALIGVAATSNYDLIISAAPQSDDLLSTATALGALSLASLPTVSKADTIFNNRDIQDYYRFSLSSASPVQLLVSGMSDNVDVELLDGNGLVVATGNATGTTIENIQRSLAAGTYFARISSPGTIVSVAYELTVSVAVTSDDLIFNAADLGTLNLNTKPTVYRSDRAGSTVDTQDFYRFTLDVDSPLRLSLSGMSQNLDARILDASGRVLYVAALTFTQVDNISLASLAAGTYYVRISGDILPTNTVYDLVLTVNVTADDVLARATSMGTLASDLPTAVRSSYTGGVLDPHDYFRFFLLNPSSVRIGLSGLTSDLNVQLLDSQGYLLNTGNKFGTTMENVLTTDLIQGGYYIRVYGSGLLSIYNLGITVATTSDDLIVSATPLGNLSAARPTVTVSDNVGLSSDYQDYYSFVLTTPSTLRVNLSGMTANLNFELLSSVGRVLNVASATGTTIENLLRTNLGAGTYYVRVFAALSANTAVSYVLTSSIAPDSDDLISNATPLGTLSAAGTPTLRRSDQAGGSADVQDYYQFTLGVVSNIRLNMSGLTSDLDVQLLNSAGAVLGSAANSSTLIENILLANLAIGTYYVRVVAAPPVTSSRYDLVLSVLTSSDDLIRTPTDVGTLDPVTLPTLRSSGAIGGPADIQDYLIFSTTATADVRISLSGLAGDLDMELLDTQGRVLNSSAGGGTSIENIFSPGLAAGNYLVRVFAFSSTTSNYDLAVTVNGAGDDLITNATALGVLSAARPTVRVSSDLTATVDTRDYYSFTLAGAASVRINLSGLSQDMDVSLLDASGTQILNSQNGSTTIENMAIALAAGTYFVSVEQFSGSSSYDLTVSTASLSDDLLTNTRGLPALDLLNRPTIRTFDRAGADADRQDYYQFALNAVSNLRINLSGLTSDLDVELLDVAGRVVAYGAQSGTTIERVTAANLATGLYFVRVFSLFVQPDSNYDLAITTVISSDDTILGAKPLDALDPVATPIILTQGAVGGSDIHDYFSFRLTAASNVGIALSNMTDDNDLFVYDSAGRVIGSSAQSTNRIESVTLNNLAAGLYYVRVASIQGTSVYDLQISSDSAQDNLISTATQLSLGLRAHTVLSGTLGTTDLQDYYTLALANTSNLRINLYGLDQDCDVELRDSVGQIVASGVASSTTIENVLSTGLAAGTYYIRVLTFGSTVLSKYTLAVGTQVNSDEFISEAGNVLGQINTTTRPTGVVEDGVVNMDNIDFHRFSLTGTSDVRFNLISRSVNEASFDVFDSSGRRIGGAAQAGSGILDTLLPGLAAGTYYVRIEARQTSLGFDFLNYKYELTVSTSVSSTQLITNAQLITVIPSTITSTIQSNEAQKFIAFGDFRGTLSITLTSVGADLKYEVFDINGEGTIPSSLRKAKYLRIFPATPGTVASFTITMTLDPNSF